MYLCPKRLPGATITPYCYRCALCAKLAALLLWSVLLEILVALSFPFLCNELQQYIRLDLQKKRVRSNECVGRVCSCWQVLGWTEKMPVAMLMVTCGSVLALHHHHHRVAGSLALSLPGHCDFEAGLCGYTQDKQSDEADWEWRRGPTPTSYTGPRGDHTTGLG